MQSLAIPLHLQENGLLRREEKSQAVLALLDVMARTPQGSWQACPGFGLRDLFESGTMRADVARLATERINASFAELGMADYVVTEIVHEMSGNRETDTYSIRLEDKTTAEVVVTAVSQLY